MRERGEARGSVGCGGDVRRREGGAAKVVDQGVMRPRGSLQRSVEGEKRGPALLAMAAERMSWVGVVSWEEVGRGGIGDIRRWAR